MARGKVHNLSLCEAGSFKEAALPRVIDAINEAIIRLYSQFPVKEKGLVVELCEGRTEYYLNSEHSWLNAKGDVWDKWDYYIIDTKEHPFEDDIQQILEIYDDLERKRPLNDPDNPLGIMVPEPNLIIVRAGLVHRVLNIIYRAKHKILTAEDLDKRIELPESLHGALLSYAAYLLHSEMNTENAVQNAQKYFAEYQNILNELIQNSVFTPDKLISDFKFIKRGFV